MRIEYFYKATGKAIEIKNYPADYLFVISQSVWKDTGETCESQEGSVSFDTFIERCPDIGWRIVATN